MSAVAGAEQWAAQDPYGGGVGPVQWGATEKAAEKAAISACKNTSQNSCASHAATAVVGTYNMFVTTCCKTDGARCVTTATALDDDAGRAEGYNAALKVFVDANININNCWRHRTYSVRTGKRLRD